MNCAEVQNLLAGYLDGALPASRANDRGFIGQHLESCAGCREELERYRQLSALMARVERPAPPADLAARIRVSLAQTRSSASTRSTPSAQESLGFLAVTSANLRRWRDRFEIVLKNILEPLALPVTGGLVTALTVFALVCQVLGVGAPLRAITNDAPTSLLQPASVESLAAFPMTGIEEASHGTSHVLLVEATVNADGSAADYRILSGPSTQALRRELDQVMLFSRFRPELSFGRPTAGGHVVLSFSEFRVHG